MSVSAEGVDPRLFDMVVHNTVAVLGPTLEQRDQWRENLIQIKGQAAAQGVEQLVALSEAIIGLLDAQGDPAGLGSGLRGIYARTWQTIVARLTEQLSQSNNEHPVSERRKSS